MDTPRLSLTFLGDDTPLPRADFLRALSAALAAAALPGCGGSAPTAPDNAGNGGGGGGGGGSGGGGGGGVPGTPVSSAERLDSLSAVEEKLQALIGTGRRYEPAAMLDFLGQQSVFSDAGYSEAATCAWAAYTDGRILMIANDPPTGGAPSAGATRAPSARTGRARTPGEGDPLLTAPQFRSVNMWTCLPLMDYEHVSESWVDNDTIPRISRIAKGLGCAVVDPGTLIGSPHFERPLIADVEGLKTVQGDGVFLLTTYGGYADYNNTPVSAFWTLTPAVDRGSLVKDYEADLDAGRLVYFTAPRLPCPSPDDETPFTSFGITPEFARHHNWSFPKGSIVYLNTTGSPIPEWQSVLEAAGARVLLGWDGAVAMRTMLGAAQDFFELVFATNKLDGSTVGTQLTPTPRLRSYGVEEVYSYLVQQGLVDGIEVGGEKGRLELFQTEFVNQIRPTIESISVDELNQRMYIEGQFGERPTAPDSGTVRIGSETESFAAPELELVADPPLTEASDDLSWDAWTPGQITTRLPEDQSGGQRRAGMVQVWVEHYDEASLSLVHRFSNVAHLTRWTVTLQITRTVGGSLQRSVTMEVSFRAFVSGYRVAPDQPLDQQWTVTEIMNEAEAQIGWSASGSLSKSASGTTTTVEWSGSGNFNRSEPALGETFSLLGLLRVPERRLECRLELEKAGGLQRHDDLDRQLDPDRGGQDVRGVHPAGRTPRLRTARLPVHGQMGPARRRRDVPRSGRVGVRW